MWFSERQKGSIPRFITPTEARRVSGEGVHNGAPCPVGFGSEYVIRRGATHLARHGTDYMQGQPDPGPPRRESQAVPGRGSGPVTALALDEALSEALYALDRCEDRDSALRVVLRTAEGWLDDVQIHILRNGFLRGQFVLTSSASEEQSFRGRGLAISASAAARHALNQGSGILVELDETDPIADFTGHRRLVLQPVYLGQRPVCLILGAPGALDPETTERLLAAMKQLADGAAVVLLRLILRSRRAG